MDSERQVQFSVGTLSYDKRGLWLVFFWLMWNDFSITLLEQVTGLNDRFAWRWLERRLAITATSY